MGLLGSETAHGHSVHVTQMGHHAGPVVSMGPQATVVLKFTVLVQVAEPVSWKIQWSLSKQFSSNKKIATKNVQNVLLTL